MKNLIFFTLLCFISSLASAQDFGRSLLSGSIGYSTGTNQSQTNQESYSNHFQINPKYGVFVSPNLVIGASVGYARQKNEYPQIYFVGNEQQIRQSKTISNSFSVGPFVRLYHPISQQFAFFGQGTATFGYGKSKSTVQSSNPSEGSYKSGNIGLNPGIVFFPSNNIGVEFSLGNIGYTYQKSDAHANIGHQDYRGFNLGLGFDTASIGISLYLGRVGAE